MCILAQDCDSAEYVRLVEALAEEHSIPILRVPEGKRSQLLASELIDIFGDFEASLEVKS